MNKEAIALAADSAVTIEMSSTDPDKTKRKIFTSANKLFALSKKHPVGILVYGNATFMEIPWETLIKIYRDKVISKEEKPHLSDYAKEFIDFLDNGNKLFPEQGQKGYFLRSLFSFLFFMRQEIISEVKDQIKNKGPISLEDSKNIVKRKIDFYYKIWEKTENIPTIPPDFNDDLLHKYQTEIDEVILKVFENYPFTKNQIKKLEKICTYIFSKFPKGLKNHNHSGIVIAGFGAEDTFPAIQSFVIEGIVNNRLKYNRDVDEKISFNSRYGIYPYAQTEMVHTFMLGVDPTYLKIEDLYLNGIFADYTEILLQNFSQILSPEDKRKLHQKIVKANKEILKDLKGHLEQYRDKYNVAPITNVVTYLPKSELALMAESLIHLTSLKRRFTDESETVADPIDVAVITKGDGFIWIKRKHYFDEKLNPQFFANYNK